MSCTGVANALKSCIHNICICDIILILQQVGLTTYLDHLLWQFRLDRQLLHLMWAINDDDVFEGNERFQLTIDQSSTPDGVSVTNPHTATVVIADDSDCKYKYERNIYSDTPIKTL